MNGLDSNFRDIPPEYVSVVQAYLTRIFAEQNAKTDEDEYLILVDLLGKTERGELIIDETGNPNNQLLELAWNDERVEADIALKRGRTVKPRDYLLIGGLGILLFGFLLYTFGFFSPAPTEIVEEIEPTLEATALPTVDVTPISQRSLEISTSLGGRIQVAEPRTIEFLGENIQRTLAIVPTSPNQSGSVNFLAPEQAEDAVVWIYGTVINYVMGASPTYVRSLTLGDDVILRTNTGQTYQFEIVDLFETEPQKVEIFSQNETPGITIFEMPAETGVVQVARARYLNNDEVIASPLIDGAIGNIITSHPEVQIILNDVVANQTANQLLEIQATGNYLDHQGTSPAPVVMYLSDGGTEYSPTSGGQIDGKGEWLTTWSVPIETIADYQLVMKTFTTPEEIVFDLSDLPDPRTELGFSTPQITFDPSTSVGTFSLDVVNSGEGVVFLYADDFAFSHQNLQTVFNHNLLFPTQVPPGGQLSIQINFIPDLSQPGTPVSIRLLDREYIISLSDLGQVTDDPVASN